jgi:hypothetical protein
VRSNCTNDVTADKSSISGSSPSSTAVSTPAVGLGASIARGLLRVRGASLELKHTKLKVITLR